MAFRFSLQTLLRLRESYERLELLRLQLLTGYVSQIDQAIARIDELERANRAALGQQLANGATGADLRWHKLCGDATELQRQQLIERRTAAEQQRQMQHAVFIKAQRQRKVLEKLRERQLERHQLEGGRRFQQALDELFLLRSAHTRH